MAVVSGRSMTTTLGINSAIRRATLTPSGAMVTTAAIASLKDIEILKNRVARLCSERERLFNILNDFMMLEPCHSQANFVLCKVMDNSAKKLKVALAKEGVLVRHYDSGMLKDYIRISVGRPQDTDRLIEALKKCEKRG